MKKLILSVDTGVDDALAIAYAAGQQQMELIGVTASYGMSYLGNTYRNTKKILELVKCDVKAWMGSSKPIERICKDYEGGSPFHGMDGLGGLCGNFKPEDIAGAVEEESIDFIIDSIHKYKKDLTLVTTGPLTDLARVLIKAPSIVDEIGSVICMAGAVAAPGNMTPFAEANAKLDSEATKIVLESGLPLTLVGLDITRKTLLTRDDMIRWNGYGSECSQFFHDMIGGYLEAYRVRYPYLAGCALHDPLAVGVALHPEWITGVPMHLTCITEGDADGRTCEDLSRCADPIYTSTAALLVDAQAFQTDFFSTVEKLF